MLKALDRAKVGKACGPDKISGRVIKMCKQELVLPMKTLFQASLNQCYVPLLWRTSEIVPVPKTKVPVEKNDLRPVALTCIFMKCLESTVKKIVCSNVSGQCDQLQFAYREHRSVDEQALWHEYKQQFDPVDIHSYLKNRPQYVKLHNVRSSVLTTNTWAPQGCVLSPLLLKAIHQ